MSLKHELASKPLHISVKLFISTAPYGISAPQGCDPAIFKYTFDNPHGGVRPFHQKSTCITQLTLGPSVVHI